MTDGIIQEVFHSWISRNAEQKFYSDSDRIQRLQTELIEKIKQEIDNNDYKDECSDCQRVGNNLVVSKLIGDNQE